MTLRRALVAFLTVAGLALSHSVLAPRAMAQDPAPAATGAEAVSIVIVDVDKILAEANAAQALQKQLESRKDAFQKEFSTKEKKLRDTEKKLLEQRESLSPEDFAKKRKEYEEQIISTRKEFQRSRNALDQALGRAMQELRRHIVEATAQVAGERNYDIVLTRDNVLIAEKTRDITNDVLGVINKKVSNIPLQVE